MAGRPSICPATLGNVNCLGRLVQPGWGGRFRSSSPLPSPKMYRVSIDSVAGRPARVLLRTRPGAAVRGSRGRVVPGGGRAPDRAMLPPDSALLREAWHDRRNLSLRDRALRRRRGARHGPLPLLDVPQAPRRPVRDDGPGRRRGVPVDGGRGCDPALRVLAGLPPVLLRSLRVLPPRSFPVRRMVRAGRALRGRPRGAPRRPHLPRPPGALAHDRGRAAGVRRVASAEGPAGHRTALRRPTRSSRARSAGAAFAAASPTR